MGLPKVAWLRIALGAIIVLGILVFYRFSVHDRFIALRESWEQERTIEAKILELREENIDLEEVIEDLNPDGREIDRIVREDLRWIRPTESMINLPEKE
ncbi:MAG: hypothetical protein CMN58_03325 [Solibacterales bacterium]|nr:hypothetical protein [Bryobacterales bacterium]|tara:strand:- start:5157 stop:5453 length:297 start_codon:yes stop_codon:yes gene_type:complete